MRRLILVLASLFGMPVAQAQVATYCVGSTAELTSALSSIDTNHAYSTTSIDLRLRSGTYLMPAGASDVVPLGFNSAFRGASYRISGGWNTGCSTQSALASQATVLDGQGQRGVLMLRHRKAYESGPAQVPTLRIDNLRFRNGYATNGSFEETGCLAYTLIDGATNAWVPLAYALLIENTVFDNCRNAMETGRAEPATIRNSLFVDNYGATPAINAFASRGQVYVTNNTFRRNEVIGNSIGAVVLVGDGSGDLAAKYVTNNVFAETTLSGGYADEVVGNGQTFVRYNRIEHIAADVGYGLPVALANTTQSPGFVGTHDHRLASNSPLRDAGQNVVVGGVGTTDLGGATRLQGDAVDLGAYELGPAPVLPDAMFANGFE